MQSLSNTNYIEKNDYFSDSDDKNADDFKTNENLDIDIDNTDAL